MRNLKKILALVLSLAMVLSVTAFAGFTDADKVDVDYAEAVTVLNGMGVFKGYTDGSFNPQGEITRAEVAAIVYRIATADVEDEYVDLWTGTSKFADVNDAAWYAGYVGFCASNGYVQGYPDGTFRPNAKVTGFEVLAMILRVNGYDAEKEFSGIKWSDNIAKVATQNDILDDVKPGALAKAAPREMVAQLLFGALNAPTVNYTLLNGYTQNKGTLGYEKFDLEKNEGEEADDFGRPAYTWTYETGNEETVFASAPLATYNVATENCDIMADADLDEGDKLDIYLNGEKDGKYTVADDDDEFGEQGQLVEIYEDRVIVIDTFLGEVTKVVAEKTDSRGHVTDAYVKVDVYMGNNKATSLEFETDEYAKGDMVLVTICDDEIAALEIAESKVQKLTKVDGSKKTIDDIQKIEQLDKEDVAVAFKADLEPEDGLTVGGNYEFYFDTYGNIIGAVELSTYYAVVDSLYSTHIDGEDAAIADLVYFDATMEEDVAIAEIDRDDAGDFDERKKDNDEYYNNVYIYTVADGEYTLTDAEFDTAEYAWVEEGMVYVRAGQNRLQISKSTEILLQFEDAPGGTYKAFVGYKDLLNYDLYDVSYIDFDEDGYIDMMYARADAYDYRTVFVYDIDPDSVEYVDGEEYCVAEVEALELVEGSLKKVTIDVLFYGSEMDEELFVDEVGLYELVEGEDGYWYAYSIADLYRVTSLTDDGLRAEINGKWFEKFDDAKFVKYTGDWQNGKTTTSNVDFDDLNEESLIYIQYNEDDEAVVVYDMWVKMSVEFAEEYEGAKLAAPDIFYGKTLSKEIEVTVPAYMDLVEEDGFTYEGTDAHAKESVLKADTDAILWDSIIITLVEDAAHSCTDLKPADLETSANIEVLVDNDEHVIYISGEDATINVADLLKAIEAECEFVKAIEVYDNTEATNGEGQLDENMYVKVIAEDGTAQQFDLVLDVETEMPAPSIPPMPNYPTYPWWN